MIGCKWTLQAPKSYCSLDGVWWFGDIAPQILNLGSIHVGGQLGVLVPFTTDEESPVRSEGFAPYRDSKDISSDVESRG
jgi:hypothetical protein